MFLYINIQQQKEHQLALNTTVVTRTKIAVPHCSSRISLLAENY